MKQQSLKLSLSKLGGVWVAAMAAALIAGCSTTGDREHMDEVFETPAFLNTPVVALFTNWSGFSGRMEIKTTTAASQSEKGKTAKMGKMGQLIGRADRLLYAPDPKGGKLSKKRAEDRTSFIWYVADSKGYVVNDALQGYAAISATAKPVSVSYTETSAATEEIDGHRCRRFDAVVMMDGGPAAGYTVWRAADLQDFPLQIKAKDGQFTLTFSKVHLQEVPAALYLPPEEYTKHASSGMMLGTLLERQIAVKKKVNLDEWDATHPDTPGSARNPR